MKRPSDDLYGPLPEEPGGPGDPNCSQCHGDGVVPLPKDPTKDIRQPPAYRRCKCVLHKDILANVERGMKGLSSAKPVRKSPLMEKVDKSVWVTASQDWFKAHLRHVAIRQPPTWFFKVVSDADLMTAWLASVALDGKEILDPDATKVSLEHLTLVDLIVPPQLLIIRTGVKTARNVATPEVLVETLSQREHLGLPTWVWDQPTWELHDTRAYSDDVGRYLASWDHMKVMGHDPAAVPQTKGGYTEMTLPGRSGPTLSGSPTRKAPSSGTAYLEQQVGVAQDPWKDRKQRKPTRRQSPAEVETTGASDDLLAESKARTPSLYKKDQ